MAIARALGLLAFLGLGCSQHPPDDLCARTVQHLFDRMMEETREAPPSEDERRIIDATRVGALETCRREGLDQEQARCILDVATFEEMMRVGSCPAIANHKPSWLRLPPTANALRDAGIEPPPP